MRKLLFILLGIISFQAVMAQSGNWNKILFTYEIRSPYILNKDGVFAEASVFAKNFASLRYTEKKSPSGAKMPFISFQEFTAADRKRLLSSLYQNEIVNGIYDKATNTTTLEFTRNDGEAKNAFAALGENYETAHSSLKIDFNAKTEYRELSQSKYTVEFKDIAYDAVFSDKDKLQATFSDKKDKQGRQFSAAFSKGLSNKVTPGELFTNNEYGISKVEGYGCTKTLTSVKYE